MKIVKHTEGPWRKKQILNRHWEIITAGGYWIGRIRGNENACLAAAAPEMLEALLDCVCAIERTAHCTEADRLAAAGRARAAIEKANGGNL